MDKEVKEIIKEINEAGTGHWVDASGKRYLKVRSADGAIVARLPQTHGRGRWKQNLRAELKRKGVL